MAEYIDKTEVLNKLQGRKTIELIMDMKPEDVIERSKIDKAIEEIEFLRQHRAKYITEDNKICIDSGEVLKILKRNIGE